MLFVVPTSMNETLVVKTVHNLHYVYIHSLFHLIIMHMLVIIFFYLTKKYELRSYVTLSEL